MQNDARRTNGSDDASPLKNTTADPSTAVRVGPFVVHEGASSSSPSPPPSSPSSSPSSSSSSAAAAASSAPAAGPVVVLFGFVGSTPRLLAKYAAAFLDTGGACSARRVYSTTAATLDVFARPARLRALALRALELLEQRHPGEPAVLAYMSNGGAFVHVHVSELLAEDEAAAGAAAGTGSGTGRGPGSVPGTGPAPGPRRFGGVRIVGTVFDSAPAYLSQDSMARAPTEAIRSAPARAVAYWLLRLLLPVALPLLHGLGYQERFWDSFAEDRTPGPVLYIYSAHDTITDCARLDALVARRRAAHALGAAGVRALRIGAAEQPASPHVQHLARHGARYREALAGFMLEATKGDAGAR